jgi:glucan phosphorylase
MDMKELMPVIIQVVLIPLLTALTGVAVKWINSKANEIKAKTNNIHLQSYIDMLNNAISSAVVAANQTYVNELKEKGEFTKEAQQEAFVKVYNNVMNTLTEEAQTCLTAVLGDLETYVTNKIEETVVFAKESE